MSRQGFIARVVVVVVVTLCDLALPALAQDCPELLGHLPGPVTAVAVEGDYAYLGTASGLVVADISDPSAPRVVGEVVMLGGPIADVAVEGGYAYVVGDGPFQVIDVRVPSAPFEVGAYEISLAARSVAVSDGRVVLAAEENGLYIFDECGSLLVDPHAGPPLAVR